MEAQSEGACQVVYFCASASHRGTGGDDDVEVEEDVRELHHQKSTLRHDGPAEAVKRATEASEPLSATAEPVLAPLVLSSESEKEKEKEESESAQGPGVTASSGRGNLTYFERIRNDVRVLLDEDVGGFEDVFVGSQPKDCLARLDACANASPVVVLVEFNNPASQGAISPSFLKDDNGSYTFLRALAADVQGARYQKHVMPFAVLSGDVDKDLDHTITSSCLEAGALDIIRSPIQLEDIHRLVGHVMKLIRPPARLLGAPMAQNLVDSIHNVSEPAPSAHRPDLTLSAARKAAVEQAVCLWHFPAQAFDMDELTYAALFMLEHVLTVPELVPFGLPRSRLMTFLLATRRQYKHSSEVYYHNWRHAVDVTQTIFHFLLGIRLCPPLEADSRPDSELNEVERLLTHLDGLILIVSAIGHDVGHPGVNNAFLVACNHPLAQMYNDKSVLENYHCAAYSQLLRRHWPSLSSITGFRSTMISNILATDMQRHFEYMSRLGEFKQKVHGCEQSLESWSDKEKESARELLMSLLIKAADISNVARPFDISSNWAKILMNEFARQGELESELQIPTCLFGGPPDKEDELAAAESQKGFMNLFGFPLFQGLTDIMPIVQCSVVELNKNQKLWEERAEKEKRRRDEGPQNNHITFSSVTADEVEEARGKSKSEPMINPSSSSQQTSSATSPTAPSTPQQQQSSTPQKRVPVTPRMDPSPSRTSAHEHRRQLSPTNLMNPDDLNNNNKRSSPSLIAFGAMPPSLSPLITDASRRSSKDIALDQLQQLSAYAHQNISPGSRRGSADWHIHQSYPGSRRGSKDESLTTIVVTSGVAGGGVGGGGGAAARRSSPSSTQRVPARSSPSKNAGSAASRQQAHSHASPSSATKPLAASSRTSAPSSRSNTTSTAATQSTTNQPSPTSTAQTSSLPASADGDAATTAALSGSSASSSASSTDASSSSCTEPASSSNLINNSNNTSNNITTNNNDATSRTAPQPSSLILPNPNQSSIPSTEDPFGASQSWPNDPVDGFRRISSVPAGLSQGLPASPPAPPPSLPKQTSMPPTTQSPMLSTSPFSSAQERTTAAAVKREMKLSQSMTGLTSLGESGGFVGNGEEGDEESATGAVSGRQRQSMSRSDPVNGGDDGVAAFASGKDEEGASSTATKAAPGNVRGGDGDPRRPLTSAAAATTGTASANVGMTNTTLRQSRSRSRLRGLRFWRKTGS